MISQAILADEFARDPHNWLLHTDLAVGAGSSFSPWLSGTAGCTSQLERPLALPLAPVQQLPASKLLQAMLFYRLPLYTYTAVHFDLLFQGSSWNLQPISGAAALVLKGAVSFAPAAARSCSSSSSCSSCFSGGLPNSGNSKLSSERIRRQACQSGKSNQ